MARVLEPEQVMPGSPLTTDDTRLHTLDILRGFALFGMILVHFHQKMRLEVSGLEDLIGWGVYVLVEQKAWGTFAFLFGVGFAILLRRLESRGAAVVPIYLRRLAALAVFGVIAEVGFGFHILFSYACWGLGLLVVRRWPTRVLLALAVAAVVARPAATGAMRLWAGQAGVAAAAATQVALRQAVDGAAEHGTYRDLISARWALFAATSPGGWRGVLPDVNFALFVIGLLAVRHGVIDAPLRHRRLIAGWMTFGAVSWALAWTGWMPGWLLGLIHDQWLCFAYIGAGLLLFASHPVWMRRLTLVGQAGRMALTNYMVQVVILDALGSSYGAGLRLRPLIYAPAAMIMFAVQAAVSWLWLQRFRFGPCEWIWRIVTYWTPQPIGRGARA